MHQPVSAAAAYADLKANHQDTARLCSAQGICFRPMVAETTGAWDKSAAHVLHIIAAAVAAREGATVAELHQRLLQELSAARRFPLSLFHLAWREFVFLFFAVLMTR
jgi:hypothetical protein